MFKVRECMMTLSLNGAGGSLVLSEGGVCVVGNLSAQKKDIRDSLQKSTLCQSTSHNTIT